MKQFALLIACVLGLAQAHATPVIPSLIRNCHQLQSIDDPLGLYVLVNDIDCSRIDFKPITIPFAGILEGQDHVIRNLHIQAEGDPSSGVGLFERIAGLTHDEPAVIQNIHFEDVRIEGTRFLGLLAGRGYSAVITNLTATHVAVGTDKAWHDDPYASYNRGGLMGEARHSAFIDVIMRDVTLEPGVGPSGGLIGHALDGNWVNVSLVDVKLISPDTNAAVQAPDSIGGVVGMLKSDDSLFLMDHVHVTDLKVALEQDKPTHIGGLVGQLQGLNDTVILDRVSAKGDMYLKEGHHVGGLLGSASMHAMITDAFTRVNIHNRDGVNVGGMLGSSPKDPNKIIFLNRIYVAGLIDAPGKHAGRAVLGSYQKNQLNVVTSKGLFDKQVTGKKYPGDFQSTSKSTKNMQKIKTYDDWSRNVWIFEEGRYPELHDRAMEQR